MRRRLKRSGLANWSDEQLRDEFAELVWTVAHYGCKSEDDMSLLDFWNYMALRREIEARGVQLALF